MKPVVRNESEKGKVKETFLLEKEEKAVTGKQLSSSFLVEEEGP